MSLPLSNLLCASKARVHEKALLCIDTCLAALAIILLLAPLLSKHAPRSALQNRISLGSKVLLGALLISYAPGCYKNLTGKSQAKGARSD